MPARPVSLLGDNHICPMINPGPIPHIGGPVVQPGQTIVRVTGRPVAVVGGQTLCTGVPVTDPMVQGSPIVRICGMPVMRIGDSTAHGGKLVMGSPIVRSS